jgi:hypothetical protein
MLSSFALSEFDFPTLFENGSFELFPSYDLPVKESSAVEASPSPLLLPVSPEEKKPEGESI